MTGSVDIGNVTLTYRGAAARVLALKGTTLSVRRSEFAAVVGPSGCGKSSLMKIVTGLVPPDSGDIVIFGDKVRGPVKIAGMAFQNPNLLPWRKVIDNVLLPLEIVEPHRRRFRRDRERYRIEADALLKTVGLAGFGERFPWELSGGMQQRVSLCRALIHQPALLMLDEPFAALDAFTREELWCVLRDLWQKLGFTVILVTHDLREAAFLADNIHVMSARPGHIVMTKTSICRARATSTFASSRISRTSSTSCGPRSRRYASHELHAGKTVALAVHHRHVRALGAGVPHFQDRHLRAARALADFSSHRPVLAAARQERLRHAVDDARGFCPCRRLRHRARHHRWLVAHDLSRPLSRDDRLQLDSQGGGGADPDHLVRHRHRAGGADRLSDLVLSDRGECGDRARQHGAGARGRAARARRQEARHHAQGRDSAHPALSVRFSQDRHHARLRRRRDVRDHRRQCWARPSDGAGWIELPDAAGLRLPHRPG